MERHNTLLGFAVLILLFGTTTSAFGGISISIGARWSTGHPVVSLPCRPAPRPRRPHEFRHFGPGRIWPHYHGCRVRVLPLTSKAICPPTVAARPSRPPQAGVITIWVTNSNGSQTEVRLARRGKGFIGPRREYYHSLPTHKQLRGVYGF